MKSMWEVANCEIKGRQAEMEGGEEEALLAARLAEPRPEISKRTKLNWTFIKRFLLMPQVPHRTNTHTQTHRETRTHTYATGRRIRRETKSSGSANDADDDDDKCGQLSF